MIRVFGWTSVFLFSALALAQSGNSVISGSVKDATGGALPNVVIKVSSLDSGVKQETVSNSEGLYRVSALLPGQYEVSAAVAGFDQLVRGPVTLQISQTIAIDLTMQVGQQNETVNVQESAPLVESQSSTVAQTVSRSMLTGLPMPNRAAASLVALAPGVVMIDSGSGTAENYPVFSVAGGRARNQNFTLDGGNVTNAVGLTRPQQLTSLPVDAMQEFRVISNNYSAEFGHSTGGIISMSTRAGTNAYHGSVFESLQNTVLECPQLLRRQSAADSPEPVRRYLRRAHPQRQDLLLRHLGADPAVDQQHDRSTVPTLLQRTGDFSELRTRIYDPATGSGTASHGIPRQHHPGQPSGPRCQCRAQLLSASQPRRDRHQRQQLRRQQRQQASAQHRRRPSRSPVPR